MKTRSGEKIKMLTVDELLGVPESKQAVEIDIDKIYPFKDHPFKVVDDEKMKELVESILANGILNPVIVRPDDQDKYEMISGHRRMFAAQAIGLEVLPAFIREMTDDESTIAMVDSNIQREEILPSEKAFAYKMRYEAMRHQGNRNDLTSPQIGTKLRADEELAKQVGSSKNQVYRFMRLTELNKELLDLVDNGRVAMNTGVDISYLDKQIQSWLYEYIRDNGVLKNYQVTALKKTIEDMESITQSQVIQILNENLTGRIPSHGVSLNSKKLRKYFPAYYTSEEMEKTILDLLAKWKIENGKRGK